METRKIWGITFYILCLRSQCKSVLFLIFIVEKNINCRINVAIFSFICCSYESTHLGEPAASIILAAFSFTSFTLKCCPLFFSCSGALCSSCQPSKALYNHSPYMIFFFFFLFNTPHLCSSCGICLTNPVGLHSFSYFHCVSTLCVQLYFLLINLCSSINHHSVFKKDDKLFGCCLLICVEQHSVKTLILQETSMNVSLVSNLVIKNWLREEFMWREK